MGWGLGSTIKASERRTLFRRRLCSSDFWCGLLRDHGGCLLLAGVDRSLHCSAERIVPRSLEVALILGEHRPWALRFGKALWSVHQDRLLVARPSQSRGIGS